MLALSPRVVDVVWAAVEPLIPDRPITDHPLGCHRPRIDDRLCFEAILFRLVTGCSWDVAGRLGKGSETTLRNRRDEWLDAGVFDALVEEALAGYDKIIGLDLSEVPIDGSQHKGTVRWARNRPQPHRPGQTRMEMGRFAFQRGVMVARRSQLGLPAWSNARIRQFRNLRKPNAIRLMETAR